MVVPLFAIAVVLVLVGLAIMRGVLGSYADPGVSAELRRPAAYTASEAATQLSAADATRRDKQILFGDLHVHTTFSSDAFFFSLPVIMGEGAHPPADACDYARFCSALDFWSINDHAELLTPEQWSETIESVRQCDALGGESSADMVSFLGWEWTQDGPTADTHYGHKNVILRDLDPVPTRPIGAGRDALSRALLGQGALRLLLAAGDLSNLGPYLDFNRFITRAGDLPICDSTANVRDLPADCLEFAETPAELFRKLDEWNLPSVVVPHGTTWGIHAPPRASLGIQLNREDHDRERQRLFEVYSGHGNSERYRAIDHVAVGKDGELVCPAPSQGFTPCCWRAGELMGARCREPDSPECRGRVERTRAEFVAAGKDPRRYSIVPGSTPEEWLECGQLPESFSPAYLYRPAMSAQYGLAIGDFSDAGVPHRYRYGLIGSSDNHKARAGNGYKEIGRKATTDAWGFRQSTIDSVVKLVARSDEPASLESIPFSDMFAPERGASFYFTGGLVAVHSASRGRTDIFDALMNREVYGTSGERMLLWFDLLDEDGNRTPMGSEASSAVPPRFEVRAVGAFEQRPGCPDYAVRGLGAQRVASLCLDECYFPGDRRKRIERIEVIRILPQQHPDEPVSSLVEDPWRVFPCEDDGSGCRVQFSDEDFLRKKREAVYYVRALEEPSPAISADPLRCERDAAGRCLATRPCYASGEQFDPDDECLAEIQERAWSSPIFVVPSPRD